MMNNQCVIKKNVTKLRDEVDTALTYLHGIAAVVITHMVLLGSFNMDACTSVESDDLQK